MGNGQQRYAQFREAMSIYEKYKPLHTKCKTRPEAEFILAETQREGYWGSIIEENINNNKSFTVTQYLIPPISVGCYEIKERQLANTIVNIANTLGFNGQMIDCQDNKNYIIMVGAYIYSTNMSFWIPPFYSNNRTICTDDS